MEQRKGISRPRLERVSVAITFPEGSMDERDFDGLPLDFLSMCICEQYDHIEDIEQVAEKALKDNFFPTGVVITGKAIMIFMRVHIMETLHVFGIGRYVSCNSPHAQYVLNSMRHVPDIPDNVNVEAAEKIVKKLSTGQAAEDRSKAGDRIQKYMDTHDEMPVPLILCASDFASKATPSEISDVFGESGDVKWDNITPVKLDVMQRSISTFASHVVGKLKRPVRVRAYGDHKWLDPSSELSEEVKKHGGVNTELVEEV